MNIDKEHQPAQSITTTTATLPNRVFIKWKASGWGEMITLMMGHTATGCGSQGQSAT